MQLVAAWRFARNASNFQPNPVPSRSSTMLVRVVLVDVNKKMIDAWQSVFEENPEVEIVHGSMLEQPVSAWVSPTNSKGSMDGGLDAVIKKHLGSKVETKLQKEIQMRYGGALGRASCRERVYNTAVD